jgi:hypothetical protein
MSDEDAAAARRYRQRAREIRAIAAEIEDDRQRADLFRIARDYERIALTRLRMGKLARASRRKPLKGLPQIS